MNILEKNCHNFGSFKLKSAVAFRYYSIDFDDILIIWVILTRVVL